MKFADVGSLSFWRKATTRGLKLFLAVLVLSALGSTAARASILGDTVVIQFLYPTSSTLFGLSATGVVTATGVTLDLFGNQSVTVFGNDVVMADENPSSFFQPATFNGVSVQDLTNATAFTSFSVDAATNLAGFDASRVFIQSGLLFINYQGLTTPQGSLAQVDFSGTTTTTNTAPVPEPSTITLLLLGSGSLTGLIRRRRAA